MDPICTQGSALPHNPGLIYASPSGNENVQTSLPANLEPAAVERLSL
jgi:hypothetical protein